MGKKEQRINKILSLLEESGNIHLKDLAQELNVSEMTIRRDLNNDDNAPIQLFGGYIVLANEAKRNPKYYLSEHESVHLDQKIYIGQIAAKQIANDDIVFFDCGTTTPHIIKYIPDALNFTSICYSLNVFLLLQKKPNCQVILCGGQFDDNNGIFSPIDDHSPLDVLYPTKAFISAAGISNKGLTCFNLNEVSWKKKVLRNASYKILVSDDSKFNQTRTAYFGEISDIDLLITNHIDHQYSALFHQHKVEVIT